MFVVFAFLYSNVCGCVSVSMSVRLNVSRLCVCVRVCACVCARLYVCACVRVFVCLCVSLCVVPISSSIKFGPFDSL